MFSDRAARLCLWALSGERHRVVVHTPVSLIEALDALVT